MSRKKKSKSRRKRDNRRDRLYIEQAGKCFFCFKIMKVKKRGNRMNDVNDIHFDDYATFDHVVPKSKGGTNGIKNLVLACRKCNNDRGDMNIFKFMFKKVLEKDLKT